MNEYGIKTIIPHFQPIVRISTREVVKYECLARFFDSNLNGIGPSDIEHLFENEDFLFKLFTTILSSAQTYAGQNISIAINVDVKTLGCGFFDVIEELSKKTDLIKYLDFEITEKNIAKSLNTLPDSVDRIRKLGYKVILDDFGTGGANIEVLEHVRFDSVKIDGLFMINGSKSPSGRDKLKKIIELLRCYHTPIVGEHIQDEDVEAVARAYGIDYGQGYLYGIPTPSIKITLP